MPQPMAGKRQDAKVHPSVTLGSVSSMEGNMKYITLDVWANKATMTFTDATNRDNLVNLRFSMVLDRVEYMNEVIKDIYRRRVKAYINMEEYETIDIPYKFNCIRMGVKSIPGAEPHILLYTKNIEGIPRLCLKGVDNGREIEVVLANSNVEINCVDPENANKARFLDKNDVTIPRFCKLLESLAPQLTFYKMFTAFFDLYIGAIRRDNHGNSYRNGANHGTTVGAVDMRGSEDDDIDM